MVHLVDRTYWRDLVERAWGERTVVWLAGVRRVGKTCLCKTLADIEYFDCELPRVRRMMDDPQGFLDSINNDRGIDTSFFTKLLDSTLHVYFHFIPWISIRN